METIIRTDNLDVGYNRTVVLRSLNLSIRQGEISVILGKSGSGKSTILKTLIGLIPPLGGSVYFWDQELDFQSEHAMAHVYERIGVLYQSSALLNSLSLYDNVALPLTMQYPDMPKEIEHEMVVSRLSRVGLGENIDKYPAELSGGMRKRGALARAMILDPEIIFCDEPSAGLDPITADELDELMLHLREVFGITFVVVTHELRSIEKIADRAIVIRNGGVHFNGSLGDLSSAGDSFIDTFFMRKKR